MKQTYLPWLLLFCALGLSATAAYYSVIGLSVVFSGAAVPVIIMGTFLEVSKISIATYLHNSWKKTYALLKVYLTLALIVLSIITSIGIYGLLSTGFQSNIAKFEIHEKRIAYVELKQKQFEQLKQESTEEKIVLEKDISKLRSALSTNTTTQSVDSKTGQLITKANDANRRSFETQLYTAQSNRDKLDSKIDVFNDSISKLQVQVLDMQSDQTASNELGTIKYVSEITGWDFKQVANIFIFILIFVFDPLAITLIIATNQAFSNNKPKINMYGEVKQPIYTQPDPPTEPTDYDSERYLIELEMNKVMNSGASSKKRGLALQQLNDQLNELNRSENSKTY